MQVGYWKYSFCLSVFGNHSVELKQFNLPSPCFKGGSQFKCLGLKLILLLYRKTIFFFFENSILNAIEMKLNSDRLNKYTQKKKPNSKTDYTFFGSHWFRVWHAFSKSASHHVIFQMVHEKMTKQKSQIENQKKNRSNWKKCDIIKPVSNYYLWISVMSNWEHNIHKRFVVWRMTNMHTYKSKKKKTKKNSRIIITNHSP